MIERAADSKIKKVKKYQAKPGKFIMFFLSPVMRKEKPFFLFDMNYYILNLKNFNLECNNHFVHAKALLSKFTFFFSVF